MKRLLFQGSKYLFLLVLLVVLVHPLPADTQASNENEKGWCCYQGKVFVSTRAECNLKKGAFFLTKADADKQCLAATTKTMKKWLPSMNRKLKKFALTTKPMGKFRMVAKPSELVRSLQRKISPGTLKILTNPGHDPIPAAADCSPTVYMWFSTTADDNVYFNDQDFTLYYSVDCATSLTVGQLDFHSTDEALAWAEAGVAGDHGSWGTYYADAAASGKLEGSIHVAPGSLTPGYYTWPIYASNNLNPGSTAASETLVFRVITRPDTEGPCADFVDCIDAMARHIAPLILPGITNNAALDDDVEAFRDGILSRHVIGLRLQREIERMSTRTTIRCVGCGETSGWNPGEPDVVKLSFCPGEYYPTDYALLHELTHKVGFNDDLIRAYMDAGLWERAESGTDTYNGYRVLVEEMTSAVAGAAFDRSRICTEY